MDKGKLVAVVVLVGCLMMFETEAQDTTTATCASSLSMCVDYLNATYPPASCCDPLKVALTTQKECLCNILVNNTALLKTLHINITEALSLPSRCNLTGAGASTNICTAPSPSPSTTNTTTTSGKNGADTGAWSGVSIVLAVMASLLLY